MIKITIEIIPFGVDSMKRVLGVMDIVNDATGSDTIGNYEIMLRTGGETVFAYLEGIPRRKDDALTLVTAAFNAVFKGRENINDEQRGSEETRPGSL